VTNLWEEEQKTAAELRAAWEQADSLAAEAGRKCHALEEELSRVKQKYRAAQHDVERARRAHAATKAQLAALQNRLTQYEQSPLWKLSVALVRFWTRLGGLARKLSGASRKQRREAIQAIAGSGLFDAEWYLKENPDVAAAGLDPLLHFHENGWREGRDPGPLFATSAYLKSNPDVARSGVNPLLHYIEHGQSEGRAVRAPATSSASALETRHNFPPAAPVYREQLTADPATRWRRSYRMAADEAGAFVAGGHVIGLVRDPAVRQSLEAALGRLATLSGFAPADPSKAALEEPAAAELVDAWYVNRIQLRTRWRGKTWPLVVRALQYDPGDGGLSLVAEGLAETELDTVDLSLVDPWFPVLMVFGRPDGSLIGARLLPFPSLCRGGLHYVELLALSPEQTDPLRSGLGLAAELEEALADSSRLVRSISVEVDGADGTSPLFDRHFQRWLEKVAAVPVVAAQDATGPAADLLGSGSAKPGLGRGTLVLPPDTVPSLSVLTLREGGGDPSECPVFLPLAIVGAEPSQPATLIEVPLSAPAALAARANGYCAAWPHYVPAGSVRFPAISAPGAIRIPNGRAMADAELLTPAMGSALAFPDKDAGALTWLLFPQEWRPEDLPRSLQALAIQTGAADHKVIIVGETGEAAQALAGELFGNRLIAVPEGENVAPHLTTPFVSYLGSGVILHDGRSAAFLTHLLDDPSIASAACALVSAERHGKSWHVSVTDAGHIPAASGSSARDSGEVAQLLWRTNFPVRTPPRDLWVARSSSARKWLGSRPPQRLATGSHVCTTLITASYLGTRSDEAGEVRVPPAPDGSAIKATALFG
jgi:hypothetical protein